MSIASADEPTVVADVFVSDAVVQGESGSGLAVKEVGFSVSDDSSCSNACSDVSCCNGCGSNLGSFCECGLGEPWRLDNNPCRWFEYGGWLSAGYTSKSTGMFNNIDDSVNFHQSWLYAERVADGSCGFDWGFRADIMYGIDSGDTQAFGNNVGEWDFINGWDRGGTYGWAMPQLYAEFAYGDLSLKAGHFFTIAGYEGVMAPGNFFYSHALTMYNSEPFTHTGVLATYKYNECTTFYAGWTLGWDTGFDQYKGRGGPFLDTRIPGEEGSNAILGVTHALSEDVTLTYVGMVGDMGFRGDGYNHSIVLDVQLTDRMNYVLQSDFVNLSSPGFVNYNDEVGINQYLFYTVNDCLQLGTRLEWWKTDAGFNHGGQSLPLGGTDSIYEVTFGANYRPDPNFTLRPEFRYDWYPSSGFGGYDQAIFAMDAIMTF